MQSHYYNPEWGRFLNADALVSSGGLIGNNMFAYCNNNPINKYDPTGMDGISYRFDLGDYYYRERSYTPGGGSGGGGGGRGVKIDHLGDFLNNTSEQYVIDAWFISRYKGKLVIKLPFGNNAAFLASCL